MSDVDKEYNLISHFLIWFTHCTGLQHEITKARLYGIKLHITREYYEEKFGLQ